MELHNYIRTLRKSWILITLLLIVGVGAGAGFSIAQTPKFQASSKVFVSTSSGQTATDLVQGNSFTVQRVKTYSDLATTPIVLLPVIAELDLNVPSNVLARQVSVTAALDTTIIDITVVDPDPVVAADIANAVSDSLTSAVAEIETPAGEDSESPVRLTRVQEADVPSAPVSPNVSVNLVLGALLGLALGIGGGVLREVLDTRVRNERDLEQIVSAPIIGGIAFDPKAKQRPLIVQSDPRSPRAESFRALRTNLSFLDVGSHGKTFVVTSSIQGEGKSTTSANLAIALADAGARVLLVDGDLRRPKVAEYMGIEGAVGLTDVLIGRAELLDVVQPWGRSKLFVLPAGRIPPNPSELLGSKAMADLIVLFAREFDAVIFDAPPLLPVTDAAVLAKSVGGAIVVAAAGKIHRNQLRSAVTVLENVGAEVSGFVLTMLPTKGPDAYGYGRYGYAYGEAYGATESELKLSTVSK
ncbi:capsular exopolysaccharide synthesis family protein [Mycetocola sp. CAN_C7]|uniref:polysaccharide biosynthesis tyrosine autokinase n=1 Tax=Mycetocola sp. CAN_C7 TaxID=2787724 RepID=UPI0018C9612D